jgi:hypothetical protein
MLETLQAAVSILGEMTTRGSNVVVQARLNPIAMAKAAAGTQQHLPGASTPRQAQTIIARARLAIHSIANRVVATTRTSLASKCLAAARDGVLATSAQLVAAGHV